MYFENVILFTVIEI